MDENTAVMDQEVTTGTDGAPEASEADKGSNYGETFRSLETKMKENPHYEPSEEEMEAFHKMRDEGEKAEEAEVTEDEESEKEPVVNAPEIEAVLKKVGAKNPAELGTKVDGLLQQLQKFNDERGATGSKVKEFEGKVSQYETSLQNQHNLLVGVLNGDKNAISQAQAIMSKAGIQVKAQAQQPDYQDFGFTEADIENAVDGPLIKGLVGMVKALKSELANAISKTDEVVKNVTSTANQDKAWNGVVNEMAAVGDKYFAEQGLRASAVRELMGQYKATGVAPEALKPLLELAEYADREGQTLEKAYKLRDYDELPKRLNKTGKPPVAKATVGLSDKLGNAAQSKTHREFSGSQLENMFRTGEFPQSWKSGETLDPNKIPAYAQDYFTNLAT